MGKPMRQPGRAAWRMGWALAALAALAARAGRADTQATETVTYQRELKQLERDLLYEGARAEVEEAARASAAPGTAAIPAHRVTLCRSSASAPRGASRSRTEPAAASRRPGRARQGPGLHQERARDALEAGGPQGAGAVRAPGTGARFDAPVNHPVSNRSGDLLAGSTQAEVSIAALGDRLVAVWNDAEGGATGTLGFGWSSDGGATWIDGGGMPASADVKRWVSDPVVTVNERTGVFYAAGMAITPAARSAIGVMRGRFEGGALQWAPPVAARAVHDTFPDKPWIVADSTSGNLYLTYTAFFRVGNAQVDQIEFQRCQDDNRTWEPPRTLSSPHDFGLVQGSRPAVGPAGELYVTWLAVDTTLAGNGLDWLRFRASPDRGSSFEREESVAGIYSNFASGAPGFNRGNGLVFPGMAVDRSRGPYRGRAYVTWNEGVDFFHDAPGDSNPRFEREPNGDAPAATGFNLGETVRGSIASSNDVDTFRFLGRLGQTVTLYLDSLATGLDVAMRMMCSDGSTRLAYSAPGSQGRVRVLVFTPPRSDQYYLRLAPVGVGVGGYRLRTGAVTHSRGRARDHRDVFVAGRDPRGFWFPPVRVNDDPPWFDNWLPEVAVAPDGRLYAAWYDWRDRTDVTCGGWSNIYLARSVDGGASWSPAGLLSDEQTDWTEVASLVAPNQGDYMALFADRAHVTAAWTDGRAGDPDVMMARHDLDLDPPLVSRPIAAIASLGPNPSRGAFDVELSLSGDAPSSLELVDLAGRRVQELALGRAAPGVHMQRFDLAPGLKPGVYWLRLVEGTRTVVRKVAVVR